MSIERPAPLPNATEYEKAWWPHIPPDDPYGDLSTLKLDPRFAAWEETQKTATNRE